MKRIKQISIIIFVLSVLSYGAYRFYCHQTVDKYSPEIDLTENEISVSISADESELLSGVTAYDSKDGDVSDSLVVESVSKFLKNNQKLVTYAAFDSDNHVGKATRTVVYSDYTSPQFATKSPFRFPVNTTDFISEVTAKDCIDGDISDKIKISPGFSIVTDTPGDYEIQLQVSNSSGDVEYLPVTVEIYDPTDSAVTPEIELKKYIVYTNVEKEIDPQDYLKEVNIGAGTYKLTSGSADYKEDTPSAGGKMSYDEIDIDDSQVNYEKAGTYEITYSMTVDKQYEGKTRLIVVVRDKAGDE
ncbi:MAG: hypothetical protein Q4B70_16140 [Lachnospiraceae bacterium]|nr:hypothetical protein [Lachnospiraceae bacterium]